MLNHVSHDIFIKKLEPFTQDLKKSFGFLASTESSGLFRRQRKATWIEPKDFSQVERLIRKHYGDSSLFSEEGTPDQFVSKVCKTFEVITKLQANKELPPDPACNYLTFFFDILANYYLFEICDKERIKHKRETLYQHKSGNIIIFDLGHEPDSTKDYELKKLPYKNVDEFVMKEIKERILFYYEEFRYNPYTVLIMNELGDMLPPKLADWLSEDQSSYATIYS